MSSLKKKLQLLKLFFKPLQLTWKKKKPYTTMAATHLITVRPVDQVVRLGNTPRRYFLDQVIFQTPGCFRLVRLFDDGLYSLSAR